MVEVVRFPDIPLYRGWGAPLRSETDARDLEVIAGAVPEGLNGCLFRCGPDRQYPPMTGDDIFIDGEGMVHMFRFENGHVDYRSRWVHTERFRLQEKARRSLFKAATGVAAPPEYVPSHVAQGIHESLQANPLRENPAWVFVSAAYRARVESDPQAQALADATWAKLRSNGNVESTAPATSSLMADDAKRE